MRRVERYAFHFPAEGAETVVVMPGDWMVEERENVVSGVAKMRRRMEKAWMMFVAMIWLRKPWLFWER